MSVHYSSCKRGNHFSFYFCKRFPLSTVIFVLWCDSTKWIPIPTNLSSWIYFIGFYFSFKSFVSHYWMKRHHFVRLLLPYPLHRDGHAKHTTKNSTDARKGGNDVGPALRNWAVKSYWLCMVKLVWSTLPEFGEYMGISVRTWAGTWIDGEKGVSKAVKTHSYT